jgi:hypothetical protein
MGKNCSYFEPIWQTTSDRALCVTPYSRQFLRFSISSRSSRICRRIHPPPAAPIIFAIFYIRCYYAFTYFFQVPMMNVNGCLRLEFVVWMTRGSLVSLLALCAGPLGVGKAILRARILLCFASQCCCECGVAGGGGGVTRKASQKLGSSFMLLPHFIKIEGCLCWLHPLRCGPFLFEYMSMRARYLVTSSTEAYISRHD